MKFGLQRIEAMLGQLHHQSQASRDRITSTASIIHPLSTSPTSPMMNSQPTAATTAATTAVTSTATATLPQSLSAEAAETVQPFPAQTVPLTLPKAKPASISSHRNATNPNLAMTLLKDVEATVVNWQLELEQVILQIQAVYAEGPIVEGWLESQANEAQATASAGVATLRHGELDHLMSYVESICGTNSARPIPPEDASRTDYRLCGLDADGQLWSRPCPTQQVPYVSLAIARYQKLRILLGKKQTLENRLNQLIQSLTVLTGQLQKA